LGNLRRQRFWLAFSALPCVNKAARRVPSHMHINIPSTEVNYSPMMETHGWPPSLTVAKGYLAAGEARASAFAKTNPLAEGHF
jgi:hypothetical protein